MSETQELVRIKDLRNFLDPRLASLEKIVPVENNKRLIKAERIIKIALAAVSKSPDLQSCSNESIYSAVFEAAELGLEAGGVMGEAYLIPYKRKAELRISFQGYHELMMRTGELKKIDAYCVYEGDQFDWQYGDNPFINHKPCGEDRDEKITHVYIVGWLVNGEKKRLVLTRDDIEKIRAKSPNKNGDTWLLWYGEMAKAKGIKRFAKLMRKSVELAQAIEIDNAADSGEPKVIDIGYVEKAQPASTAAKVEDALDVEAEVAGIHVKDEEPDIPIAPERVEAILDSNITTDQIAELEKLETNCRPSSLEETKLAYLNDPDAGWPTLAAESFNAVRSALTLNQTKGKRGK